MPSRVLNRRRRRQLHECVEAGDATRLGRLLRWPARQRIMREKAFARKLMHIACCRPWDAHTPQACLSRNLPLEELLKSGVDVNIEDDEGNTPLFITCSQPHALSSTCALIAAGANINHHNAAGETPLHIAASNGLVHTTETLLSAGAITIATLSGDTPLMLALKAHHIMVAQLLLSIEAAMGREHLDAVIASLQHTLGMSPEVRILLSSVKANPIALGRPAETDHVPIAAQRRAITAHLFKSRGFRYVTVSRNPTHQWPFVVRGCIETASLPTIHLLPSFRQGREPVVDGDAILAVDSTAVAASTHAAIGTILDDAPSKIHLLIMRRLPAEGAAAIAPLVTSPTPDLPGTLFHSALRKQFLVIAPKSNVFEGPAWTRRLSRPDVLVGKAVGISHSDYKRIVANGLCIELPNPCKSDIASEGSIGHTTDYNSTTHGKRSGRQQPSAARASNTTAADSLDSWEHSPCATLLPAATINRLGEIGVTRTRALLELRIQQLQRAIHRIQHHEATAQRQFEWLRRQPDPQPSCDAGKRFADLNRYEDVLPFDHTRVVLDVDEDGYINASGIRDVDKHVRWIATQAPIPQSFDRFWVMVWHERVAVIVMLTDLTEGGRVKCDRYWPGEEHWLVVSHLSVKLEAETSLSDRIVDRHFVVHNCITGEMRVVHQLLFRRWFDFTAPEGAMDVIRLRAFVQKLNPPIPQCTSPRPVVVHCSAGVGRTGTFIAIDYILSATEERLCVPRAVEALDAETNVAHVVATLRRDRMKMVKTESQYAFIFAAVRAALSRVESTMRAHVEQMQPVTSPRDRIHQHTMQQLAQRLRDAQGVNTQQRRANKKQEEEEQKRAQQLYARYTRLTSSLRSPSPTSATSATSATSPTSLKRSTAAVFALSPQPSASSATSSMIVSPRLALPVPARRTPHP
ncbi:hypothetical protein PTSG_05375 [Salpingoeca rosetta]|uniref:Uncharacterized protein n=1 Tax=Salpingoeca rosetta (strain ATCC 50818 / BSB-021) TaxID=946362 RepID=F2UA87_SALR5|nr:uncharacterized protein PTSG_05375 [Salpingoeca rosetta]EGD73662.1 hypothetical protein PTSG_05375 [Salpingoeca rosetta]|eukprot:XP_004993943.1 hypothetical protein PTSG_05375 [Salpingoeca rosetta]